jgi:hypothetical protein
LLRQGSGAGTKGDWQATQQDPAHPLNEADASLMPAA